MPFLTVMILLVCLLSQPAAAQLSGPITGDFARGDYHIAGAIQVRAGERVHLQPGVRFLFDGPWHFQVDGELVAEGSEGDSVFFSPNTALTSYWTGIRFRDPTGIGILRFCVVEGCSTLAEGTAAVYLATAAVRVENSHIRRNFGSFGAGISAWSQSNLTLSGSIVSGNESPVGGCGGGLMIHHSEGRIEDSRIVNNRSDLDGGGICTLDSAYLYIHNSVISGNYARLWGGGLDLAQTVTNIEHCRIDSNSARDGGGLNLYQYSTSLRYTVLSHNTASTGAAVRSTPHVSLEQCTVVDNASQVGSAALLVDGLLNLNSTIVARTVGGYGIVGVEGLNPLVNFCNFFDNESGDWNEETQPGTFGNLNQVNANGDSCDATRNIFFDPQFVNTEEADYQLSLNSRCIDAGDTVMPRDADGTIADMGALAFLQSESPPSHAPQPRQTGLLAAYPNPFNASTRLEFELAQPERVRLRIVNLMGQEVARLLDELRPPGPQAYVWDAPGLSSGVYLAVLESGGDFQTQKLLILK